MDGAGTANDEIGTSVAANTLLLGAGALVLVNALLMLLLAVLTRRPVAADAPDADGRRASARLGEASLSSV